MTSHISNLEKEIDKHKPSKTSYAAMSTWEFIVATCKTDPKQKAFDEMKTAVITLKQKMLTIDNYRHILNDQSSALAHKNTYEANQEKMLIANKIKILDKIETNINSAVEQIHSQSFSNKQAIKILPLQLSDEDKALLNNPRHSIFANICGDILRGAYAAIGALTMLSLIIAVGLLSAMNMSPLSNDCASSVFSLGFSAYHSHRIENYGQFFSSGKTSSCQIAEQALTSLNEVAQKIQDFNSVTPSL